MKKNNSVLLISSSGGHWVQISKLVEGLDGVEYDVATVDPTVVGGLKYRNFYEIRDFNRDTPLKAMVGVFNIISVVLKTPSTHIISTGAAPGLVAMIAGRILGRKTLWLDSIANARQLSLSGRVASRIANLTLTQWEEVAAVSRSAVYGGKVV